MSKIKNDLNDFLFKNILKIETIDEAYAFFEDLFTINELESIGQRLVAAKKLIEGKTYEEIIEETKISSTTLSRVSTCVRHGNGGYKSILNKK